MSAVTNWLPPLVARAGVGGDMDAYLECVYGHFRADFIESVPTYPGRRWAMKRHPLVNGREATFWHVISEGSEEAARQPCPTRCARIRWVRPIIDAAGTDRVRTWQNQRAGETRVLIALADFSHLVVLADRTEYIMLWTAYPVEREHRRRELKRGWEAFARASAAAQDPGQAPGT